MSGIQDFVGYQDDFLGDATFPTSADAGSEWLFAETGTSGTPTAARSGINGEAVLALTADDEVQVARLNWGDALGFDPASLQYAEFRVRTSTGISANSTLTVGLGSAGNDDVEAMTAVSAFKADGGNTITITADDGTNDYDDVSTGKSFSDEGIKIVIDYAGGTADVKFQVDGANVATTTTFDLSNYTDGLQPFVQLQKASGANADQVEVDYVYVQSTRS